jgi:hypothetical protein
VEEKAQILLQGHILVLAGHSTSAPPPPWWRFCIRPVYWEAKAACRDRHGFTLCRGMASDSASPPPEESSTPIQVCFPPQGDTALASSHLPLSPKPFGGVFSFQPLPRGAHPGLLYCCCPPLLVRAELFL